MKFFYFFMMLRFSKLQFWVRHCISFNHKPTLFLYIFLCLLLWSPNIHAQTSVEEKQAAETTQNQEGNSSKKPEPAQRSSKRWVTGDNEDWRQTDVEKPQFDLLVTSTDPAIEELLQKYLDLYRYRMLADLSNLELRRLLQHTESNIVALTSTQGYFSPEIDIKLIPSDQRTDGSLLPLISIHVEPGQITTISQLELLFEGNIAEDQSDILISSLRRRLRWAWAMREDDPFTQAGWGKAKSNMLSRLTSQYYAAGKIANSKATIDPEDHSANLSITLDSGPRFYLGDYKIETLQRYSERLVRNFARLREGDDYLLDELNNAQQRLMESGYFDAVYVYVLPDDPDPAKATIHVNVREAYYQKMTVGPGYSTDNGPRLTFEYRHNEVPLLDWQLNSSLNIDKDKQYIDAALLSIPEDDYWRWRAYGKLQNEELHDERTKSIQASYGKSYTSTQIDRAYFLQFDHAKTRNINNHKQEDVSALSINTALTWRYFNNLVSPRRGWGAATELGVGSTYGDRSTPFVRLRTKGQVFLPFEDFRNGFFNLRGEVGTIFIQNGYPIPKTLLFLTGGDRTVRGYAFESINVNGVEEKVTSAGKHMLIGGVEYQRPIRIDGRPSAYSWATFVDTGAVTNDWKELNFYTGVGVGFRWASPVGPLNVDLAHGLKGHSVRLHFNIGFRF